ncbi:MAG: hypothetical protein AB1724_05095 [Thermodesulfobacteriota bacterium]
MNYRISGNVLAVYMACLGTAGFLLGAICAAFAAGTVHSDETTILQRILGTLFGLTLMAGSGTALCLLAKALARDLASSPVRRSLTGLFAYIKAQITGRSLASSALLFVTMLDCLAALRYRSVFPANIMDIEFLAIHASLFLGLIAAARPATRRGAALKYAAFASLLGIYAAIAVRNIDAYSAAVFLFLVLGKFAGMYFNPPDTDERAITAARWIMNLVIFMSVVMIGRAVGADGPGPAAAAVYFGALGLLEAVNFYGIRFSEETAAFIRSRLN